MLNLTTSYKTSHSILLSWKIDEECLSENYCYDIIVNKEENSICLTNVTEFLLENLTSCTEYDIFVIPIDNDRQLLENRITVVTFLDEKGNWHYVNLFIKCSTYVKLFSWLISL